MTYFCILNVNVKVAGLCSCVSSYSEPPTGFSPKARNGRDFSCHGSYGSLPRDACDKTPPGSEGSPIRGYTTIEVTNV
ncbi:hypothetical protein NHX12_012906 [Muraenolepis orangiensis]|uniref:Uncharacterized protein n=1 Tax=Muraenolepis orangiensis TaxID=630683 RepID=A0A9Q0DDK5_9TELE|nr:hypothetical protein NHX12_012906 [Muraenolepis orangiensis]